MVSDSSDSSKQRRPTCAVGKTTVGKKSPRGGRAELPRGARPLCWGADTLGQRPSVCHWVLSLVEPLEQSWFLIGARAPAEGGPYKSSRYFSSFPWCGETGDFCLIWAGRGNARAALAVLRFLRGQRLSQVAFSSYHHH